MAVMRIFSEKHGFQDMIYDDLDHDLIVSVNPFPYARPENNTIYAHGRLNGKQVCVHRLIVGASNPKIHVDHIDGNGLNNSRVNLRQCSASQNIANSRVSKNNKLGIKGVIKMPHGKNPYRATIGHLKKKHHIGCFATLDQAIFAYNTEALIRFGPFAKLNKSLFCRPNINTEFRVVSTIG